jgi:hypothetical protein
MCLAYSLSSLASPIFLQHINIPDRIKTMCWISGSQICAAMGRNYVVIDIKSRAITELFPISGSVTSVRNSIDASNLLNPLGSGPSSPMVGAFSSPHPFLASLPNGEEVIVVKESKRHNT